MTDKIYIQIGDKKQEAKGEQLKYVESWQSEINEYEKLFEAEQTAKEATLQSAINKLAALGLTEDEAKAIVGA